MNTYFSTKDYKLCNSSYETIDTLEPFVMSLCPIEKETWKENHSPYDEIFYFVFHRDLLLGMDMFFFSVLIVYFFFLLVMSDD